MVQRKGDQIVYRPCCRIAAMLEVALIILWAVFIGASVAACAFAVAVVFLTRKLD